MGALADELAAAMAEPKPAVASARAQELTALVAAYRAAVDAAGRARPPRPAGARRRAARGPARRLGRPPRARVRVRGHDPRPGARAAGPGRPLPGDRVAAVRGRPARLCRRAAAGRGAVARRRPSRSCRRPTTTMRPSSSTSAARSSRTGRRRRRPTPTARWCCSRRAAAAASPSRWRPRSAGLVRAGLRARRDRRDRAVGRRAPGRARGGLRGRRRAGLDGRRACRSTAPASAWPCWGRCASRGSAASGRSCSRSCAARSRACCAAAPTTSRGACAGAEWSATTRSSRRSPSTPARVRSRPSTGWPRPRIPSTAWPRSCATWCARRGRWGRSSCPSTPAATSAPPGPCCRRSTRSGRSGGRSAASGVLEAVQRLGGAHRRRGRAGPRGGARPAPRPHAPLPGRVRARPGGGVAAAAAVRSGACSTPPRRPSSASTRPTRPSASGTSSRSRARGRGGRSTWPGRPPPTTAGRSSRRRSGRRSCACSAPSRPALVRRRGLADVSWPLQTAPSDRERLRALARELRDDADWATGVGAMMGWERKLRRAAVATRHETRVRDPELLAELARRERFSVTELERYGDCSSMWFVDRVLSPREIDFELDARMRGSIAHATLARFFTLLPAELGLERLCRGRPAGRLPAHAPLPARGRSAASASPDSVAGKELARALERDLDAFLRAEAELALPLVAAPVRGPLRRADGGAGAEGRPAHRRLRRVGPDRSHRHGSGHVPARARVGLQVGRERALGGRDGARGPAADPALHPRPARPAGRRAARRHVPGAGRQAGGARARAWRARSRPAASPAADQLDTDAFWAQVERATEVAQAAVDRHARGPRAARPAHRASARAGARCTRSAGCRGRERAIAGTRSSGAAIERRGHVFVAAGAGTGKTAVLVERVLGQVLGRHAHRPPARDHVHRPGGVRASPAGARGAGAGRRDGAGAGDRHGLDLDHPPLLPAHPARERVRRRPRPALRRRRRRGRAPAALGGLRHRARAVPGPGAGRRRRPPARPARRLRAPPAARDAVRRPRAAAQRRAGRSSCARTPSPTWHRRSRRPGGPPPTWITSGRPGSPPCSRRRPGRRPWPT